MLISKVKILIRDFHGTFDCTDMLLNWYKIKIFKKIKKKIVIENSLDINLLDYFVIILCKTKHIRWNR